MRLRRSFRLGIESYRTGDKSIVIPAKAGTQDPKASSLALDPRFCGGDEKGSNLVNIRGSGEGPD
jgi:hypothetical protein